MNNLYLQYRTYEMLESIKDEYSIDKTDLHSTKYNLYTEMLEIYRFELNYLYRNRIFKLNSRLYEIIDFRVSQSGHHCLYIKIKDVENGDIKLCYNFGDINFE